jgi:hypothetical protein
LRPDVDLARELAGDLLCAGCNYNLRSMSIRGVCPECGTPVRATILARIDPYAEVLRPISWPVLTAAGLMVWSMFSLAAALLTWGLRGADAWSVLMDVRVPSQRTIVLASTACLAVAGLASAVLIRPHSGIPIRQQLRAAGGVLAIFIIAAAHWHLHARFDPGHVRPYFQAEIIAERSVVRLIIAACLLGAIQGLRPSIRMLASRSLVMRMGRVDRQTMTAMSVVVCIGAAGDLLHLAGSRALPSVKYALYVIGLTAIVLTSVLLTLGLVGIVVDCIRLVPVIMRPPISMRQVLGEANNRA